ncbi:hypothetical protein [Streptomyces cellostaticus]|uniref:hypothetical protein n=1 Tax=Streptomyces cellostaticus TaxID=67285 RepID=UPI001ABFAEBE|nr:hypothetical protein [Streptomyces cellostaticus]
MDDDEPVLTEATLEEIYHVVREPGFSAYFLLGAEDEVETVSDVDAWVRLPDGSKWTASMLTLDAVAEVLTRWKATGEHGGGAFFACPDLVIVPEPGVPAMTAALREIVAEGPRGTLQPLPDPDAQPSSN